MAGSCRVLDTTGSIFPPTKPHPTRRKSGRLVSMVRDRTGLKQCTQKTNLCANDVFQLPSERDEMQKISILAFAYTPGREGVTDKSKSGGTTRSSSGIRFPPRESVR